MGEQSVRDAAASVSADNGGGGAQEGAISAIGQPLAHDSAHLHVTGLARYCDDVAEPRNLLHAAVGMSTSAHADLVHVSLSRVRSAPGVVLALSAGDIPGDNNCGPVFDDDPIFAPGVVHYAGQSIFAVAATTVIAARRAVHHAQIDYRERPSILTAREAHAAGSYVLPSEQLVRGDSRAAIDGAAHRLTGAVTLGGQDQFYLEGHIAIASPEEDGAMHVLSSTQHPSEMQHLVARALGIHSKDVVVECRRMGGAFGGKESQAALVACIAALLARATQRPVKLRLDRDVDMAMTGKRHDFEIDYEVGFTSEGLIQGVYFNFMSRCGMSADLSGAINDRAMFHADNAYFLEHVTIDSHRCKTNTVSNTAFRGFGGPQGMFAIEYVLDEIARSLNLDPLDVRQRNFYGHTERNITPYGQLIDDNIVQELTDQLASQADYRTRRHEIDQFNATHRWRRRGIALTPVKFGISFTATHLNQAGALVHVYKDGTVQVNHGGTEMGQGLFTKIAQVVSHEFSIDVENIKVTATDTSKVPNTSPTAASSGSDLNGKAAQAAARIIKGRLVEFAAEHFRVPTGSVQFSSGFVRAGTHRVGFAELVEMAYMARVSLSSTGFYRTPEIYFDRSTFSGRPFYYFAYGVAASEVVVDVLTGEYKVTRVDILHDCGDSLNPALDRGQIEGGFVQGMGWLTSEELHWNGDGTLTTHAPSTYKIPVCSDVPEVFNVSMVAGAPNREDTIHRSKAVGEPPLMLALSVFYALKDAVSHGSGAAVRLDAPATPERILTALATSP